MDVVSIGFILFTGEFTDTLLVVFYFFWCLTNVDVLRHYLYFWGMLIVVIHQIAY